MERDKTQYTPEALTLLSRVEVRQMLATELNKATSEINDEFVRLLLAELQSRGNDPKLKDDATIEQASEKFRQETKKHIKNKTRWYQSWIVKAASVLIVVGILLFSFPRIAEAAYIQDVLTYWSDSMFRFFTPGEKNVTTKNYVFQTDNPDLQRIYDTATELGIAAPVVPMWVPEEFELCTLEVFDFAEDQMLYAVLEYNEKNICLSVITHGKDVAQQYEKDAQNVKTVEIQDIDHYVMTNYEESTITWWIDNIECSVVTDCQEENIYKLLYSIYTPED